MLIRQAETSEDIRTVQTLWTEYWTSAGLDDDFQGFAEECAALPGLYAPPGGLLLLAFSDNVPAGTIALRSAGEQACEVKRLFVRPEFRGSGLGRILVEHVKSSARSLGYTILYADTLPSMEGALRLYRQLGFSETAPYSSSPTPGAIYLRCSLAD